MELKKLLLYQDAYNTSRALEEELKHQEHFQTKKMETVSPELVPRDICAIQCIIGQNLLTDIEMVTGYHENASTVMGSIDRSKLLGARPFLTAVLTSPIHNIEKLVRRQALVKEMQNKAVEIEGIIDVLTKYEKDMLWLYETRDAELVHLYDMVFFKNMLVRPLNNRGDALTAYNTYRILGSPLVGILTPIAYFVVPYLVFKFKFKFKFSFVDYLKMSFAGMTMSLGGGGGMNSIRYISYAFSLVFYFQGVFNSMELAKAVYEISKLLTNRIQGVIRFIQAAKKVSDMVFTPHKDLFDDYFAASCENHIKPGLDTFEDVDTYHGFSLLSNYGRSLRVYKYLDKHAYIPLLNRAWMVDCIMSINRARNECGFSWAEYQSPNPDNKVCLIIHGVWHPCLNRLQAVKNDLVLGQPNNVLLTGPNAGGKSTLLKSILIAVVLAQTIGVTNTQHLSITPFAFVNSQIHVPDCKGKESLFEAEMHRSKKNFDVLKELGDRPSLIVMDEIFNSTNPVEGIAGAYAIAKSLAGIPSNISVISTHYLYLTKLAKDLPHAFVNYKMNVRLDDDGNLLSYPYRLSKGVSKQYVALELLKMNGFDPSIIQEALAIKQRLTTPSVKPSQSLSS